MSGEDYTKALKIGYPDRDPIWLPATYHAQVWLPHESLPPVVGMIWARSVDFREYDTFAVPLGKFMRCRELAEIMHGFFDITAVWQDGLVTVAQIRGKKSDPFPYAIKPGGKDGNEPIIHMGIGSFKEIGNINA